MMCLAIIGAITGFYLSIAVIWQSGWYLTPGCVTSGKYTKAKNVFGG
jgi:hypothetical protein